MADQVELLTGGRTHGGWQSIRVTRSMEHAAGSFSLAVSERWPGVSAPLQIHNGQACEVLVAGETLITGYVDQVESDLDAASHLVTVAGRDKVADLIDCSAIVEGGQWRGRRVEQLAADLARPFDVRVSADVDTGKPLTSFALQTGETVFEAMLRAARLRGLLLVSDSQGGLLITRAGTQQLSTTLRVGENLLSCNVKSDWRDRFSKYIVLGQAPGNDYFNGTAAAHISATATDRAIQRFRPTRELLLVSDTPDIGATLQDRTQWEANTRAARSFTVTAKVQGWRHAEGLWAPNRLVPVVSAEQHLDDTLLISAVEFGLSESEGTTTTLTLVPMDAFSLEPARQAEAAAPATDSFWTLPKVEVGK